MSNTQKPNGQSSDQPDSTSQPDLAAILGSARLPERVVSVCLRGDLQVDFERAEAKLTKLREDALRDGGAAKLTGNPPEIAEQSDEIERLRDEMAQARVEFRLRAMPRKAWRDFSMEHPPREGNKNDQALGFNPDAFFDDLIRRSIVDPELDDDTFEQVLGALTSRQFDSLADAAWGLNRGDVDVPFSYASSQVRQSSGSE